MSDIPEWSFRCLNYMNISVWKTILLWRGGKGQKFWKENLIIKVLSQISIFRGEILDLFDNFFNSHEKEEFEIQSS